MKKNNDIINIILIGVLCWIALTSTIYRFKYPNKTETEAFIHIPKSFILNFTETNSDQGGTR